MLMTQSNVDDPVSVVCCHGFRAAVVNPLKPEGDKEQQLFEKGESKSDLVFMAGGIRLNCLLNVTCDGSVSAVTEEV